MTKLDEYYKRNRLISRAAAIEELMLSSENENSENEITNNQNVNLENVNENGDGMDQSGSNSNNHGNGSNENGSNSPPKSPNRDNCNTTSGLNSSHLSSASPESKLIAPKDGDQASLMRQILKGK